MKKFSRVFIKNEVGNVLIIRDRGSIWNLPGGKQEYGEDAIECAIREVREEVNLQVLDLEEIYSGDFIFNNEEWQGNFYFANSVSGLLTLNEPNIIKEIKFIRDLNLVEFSTGMSPLLNYVSYNNVLTQKDTNWR